ncbi:MAG: hypothetical protein J7513_04775 [Solirubrobacteraceae bacterium]|nr:hypothetical protein [Solirubrobacteraceae bacterium]
MTTTTTRTRTLLLTAPVALLVLVATLALRPAPVDAQGTNPTPIDSVVLRMTGSMTLTLDKQFVKTLKAAKATVRVKEGAKYKGRNITFPIDASTTASFETGNVGTADILGTGTVMFRKKDGRKVLAQDVALRLRSSGADLGATLRGKPEREFAAFTLSPTIAVEGLDGGGYRFKDVQMLVSLDLAAAAKKAKIKGVKAGALLGLLNAEVTANLPSFTLPGISIGGTDVTGGLIPTTP